MADTVTSVDTTGTNGTVTISIQGDRATYTGGAGKDIVTITNPGTAISKAIDLGAGDDTLVLSAGTPVVPTATLKGGEGTDTIKLAAADAASLTTSTAFAAKIDSFEKLEVASAAGNSTDSINLANLNNINYVITNGMAAGAGNVQEIQTFTVANGVTANATRATQTLDLTGSTRTDGNITVGGVTVAVLASDSVGDTATKIAAALDGQKVTVGVALTTQNVAAAASGNVVTITYDTRDGAPSAQLAVANGTSTLTGAPATTTAGVAYSANAQTITVAGQTVTLVAQDQSAAGVAVAGSGDDTAAEVAAKIVAKLDTVATFNAAGTAAVGADVTVKWEAYGNQDPINLVGGATGVTFTTTASGASKANAVADENTAGKFATELTFTNLTSGATVEMKDAGVSTVATIKNATTNLTDVLNVVTNASNTTDLGTLKAAKVETININVKDTDPSTAVSTNTLKIDADKADKINITGEGNLVLTLTAGTSALTEIDGTAATGKLNITAQKNDGENLIIRGGSKDDTLTSAGQNDKLYGGAGNDTLKAAGTIALVILDGGAGIDKYNVSGADSKTAASVVRITNLEKGETIKFVADADASFLSTKFEMTGGAGLESYVGQALAAADAYAETLKGGAAAKGIAWFQTGGNTYIVQDVDGDGAFSAGDIVVELVGNVDLSDSSFNDNVNGTLLYI